MLVLSSDNVISFFMVLLSCASLLILFANAIESIRKIRKPKDDRENALLQQQLDCKNKFSKDYDRLNEHEKRITYVEETNKVLCEGIHALLEHELYDGNTDEMRAASAALFSHLNK